VFDEIVTLLEILSFATSHYATGMQLLVVCNYKLGVVFFLGHMVMCAINMHT